MKFRHQNLRRYSLTTGVAITALTATTPLNAQVIWKQMTEDQAEQNKILYSLPGSSNKEHVLPQPVAWGTVQSSETNAAEETTGIVWNSVPSSDSPINGSELNSSVVWEVIPEVRTPLSPAHSNPLAEGNEGFLNNVQEEPAMPSRTWPENQPLPPIQALNRSIAFGDGLVGPDIGWFVPNGFRWSQRWLTDITIESESLTQTDRPSFEWSNGDALSTIHVNLLQTKSWSAGLNTSLRIGNQHENVASRSLKIGEGIASGFRIAKAINHTTGVAFGGEQILQWDSKTNKGRNFYLMASKGWWLGDGGKSFPILIANGGFGTGSFANQDIGSWENPLRFACIKDVENRSGSYRVDNDLCWSPIGTVSVVMNEWWGMFFEYRSGTALAAASLNLTGGIPLRLTWGVNFAKKNQFQNRENLAFIFRASLAF